MWLANFSQLPLTSSLISIPMPSCIVDSQSYKPCIPLILLGPLVYLYFKMWSRQTHPCNDWVSICFFCSILQQKQLTFTAFTIFILIWIPYFLCIWVEILFPFPFYSHHKILMSENISQMFYDKILVSILPYKIFAVKKFHLTNILWTFIMNILLL